MNLREIVVEQAIVPRLHAVDRDGVINELVSALISAGVAEESAKEALVKRFLDRESKGSTGFGKGVAVPHVKHGSIPKMSAAIGLSAEGVDFNAYDRQPVYTVFLLLSPDDKPEEHLQAMEVIFKNLSKDTFRRFLRQSDTVEAVAELLTDADEHRIGG
ncbi:MAG: PTS fructose transporter subunit IIA [Phycisphaeraceae bacterium]|nr:MAG: PTS fructose transporter subunit IIA [Phycisphaeraceae bacterium]